LENPCKTRAGRDAAQRREKFPFVFSKRKFGFPNFSKTIFGQILEYQKLAGEKIWKTRFFGFGGLLDGDGSMTWRSSKKQHSTIPHFPKENVHETAAAEA